MIREIIKPTNNNLTISIPDEYVNEEIELLLFPINKNEAVETNHKHSNQQNITNSLFGALKDSKTTQGDCKRYIENKYL